MEFEEEVLTFEDKFQTISFETQLLQDKYQGNTDTASLPVTVAHWQHYPLFNLNLKLKPESFQSAST